MNAEMARLNKNQLSRHHNVLPLGKKPEGNILEVEMKKFEKAMKNLFLNIDKLKFNIKILKEKNSALEKFVKNMEVKKHGHK